VFLPYAPFPVPATIRLVTAKPDSSTQGGSRDLTTGSIPRHLIMFSLPMMAGSFLQAAYAIVNAYWVGSRLGAVSLAAVSVSFPLVFLLVAVANGLTLATSILVAQHVGAKAFARVKPVVQNSVLLVAVFSALLIFVGHAFADHVMGLMDTPADVAPLAVSFFKVSLYSLPAMFGVFLLASALRGAGDSYTPLYFQGVGLVLVAILDPLLMFGWLGFPRLGLNGTAIAQALVQSVAVVVLFIYLARKQHLVSPDWAHIGRWWDWATAALTLRIGLPSMLQQAMVSMGAVVVMGLVNYWGSNTTAAFGGAQRLEMIAFMPAMTLSLAASSLAGQNIGARRFDRVQQVFWWGIALSAGITLLVSLLVVTQGHLLMGIFRNEGDDPSVVLIGAHYLQIVGASYVVFAVMFISNGIINGSGHTVFTTIITLIAMWGVRVPVAWYLSQRSLHSVDGVWYGMIVGFVVSCVISLGYYASGKWRIPVVRRGGVPHPEVEVATLEESVAPPELDCGGDGLPPCPEDEPAAVLDTAEETA
jgi:putative MATE family efflux protein